jgi:hypothetical protein
MPTHIHAADIIGDLLSRFEPVSSVSIVFDYGLDDRQRIFPLTSAFRPGLGSTQPLVWWVTGFLSPGVKRGRSVMLTTHPLPMPRLRKSRSCTSSPAKRHLWCSGTSPFVLITCVSCNLLLCFYTPLHLWHSVIYLIWTVKIRVWWVH